MQTPGTQLNPHAQPDQPAKHAEMVQTLVQLVQANPYNSPAILQKIQDAMLEASTTVPGSILQDVISKLEAFDDATSERAMRIFRVHVLLVLARATPLDRITLSAWIRDTMAEALEKGMRPLTPYSIVHGAILRLEIFSYTMSQNYIEIFAELCFVTLRGMLRFKGETYESDQGECLAYEANEIKQHNQTLAEDLLIFALYARDQTLLNFALYKLEGIENSDAREALRQRNAWRVLTMPSFIKIQELAAFFKRSHTGQRLGCFLYVQNYLALSKAERDSKKLQYVKGLFEHIMADDVLLSVQRFQAEGVAAVYESRKAHEAFPVFNEDLFAYYDAVRGFFQRLILWHRNGEDKTALLLDACKWGDPQLAKEALAAGANLFHHDDDANHIPIHVAARNNSAQVIDILLADEAVRAPQLAQMCDNGLTALHHAATLNSVAALNKLLAFGADVLIASNSPAEHIPLHCAVLNDHVEAVEALLADQNKRKAQLSKLILRITLSGEDMLRLQDQGRTDFKFYDSALSVAVYNDNPMLVRVLVACGADVFEKDKNDMPLLVRAAGRNCYKAIRELLRDESTREQLLLTGKRFHGEAQILPLHEAVYKCNLRVVFELLSHDSTRQRQLLASTRMHQTALHIAAKMGNASLVSALLECGADPSARTHDESNITALEIARRYGYHKVALMLEAHQSELEANKQDADGDEVMPDAVQAAVIDDGDGMAMVSDAADGARRGSKRRGSGLFDRDGSAKRARVAAEDRGDGPSEGSEADDEDAIMSDAAVVRG